MNEVKQRTIWDTATGILLGVFALLIILTFGDYGVTVDEKVANENGRYFFNWFASGFHDRAVIDEGNQRLYGSAFNALSAFVAKHSPIGLYDTDHLVIAITSLVGVFFAYRLGRRLAGPMAGFFSALLLLLTPVYYGHSFMNPKDIPFAVMFLICLYYMIAAYEHLPRLTVKWIAILGVTIGVTLGIRVGALMLFGYVVVLIALWMLAKYRKSPSPRGLAIAQDLWPALLSCIGIGVVAWMLMLLFWPYGQISPILNPLRGLRRAANFTDFNASSLYQGRFIPSDRLPWDYLPTWFSITLPEFYAVILLIGIFTLVVRRMRKMSTDRSDPDQQSKLLFLIFAACFPIVTAIVMHPILYDGNRHFLFVIPPLAVLTGVTFAWLISGALPGTLKIATAAGVIAICGLTMLDMIRLHPYEYIFFNRSFGGLRAALGRYETDYWGVSHKEGVQWLIDNYKPDAPKNSIRVANTAADYQTSYYLRGNDPRTTRFTPVGKHDHPDVMLSITRYDVHLKYPGKVLHVVERMDTPLLYVTELNPR